MVRCGVPCLHVCVRERGRFIHIYTHIWSGTRRIPLHTCVCVWARATGYISTHTSKVIRGGVPCLHVCEREHGWSFTYLHTQLKCYTAKSPFYICVRERGRLNTYLHTHIKWYVAESSYVRVWESTGNLLHIYIHIEVRGGVPFIHVCVREREWRAWWCEFVWTCVCVCVNTHACCLIR